jgi:adenylosuccinate synthase
MGGHNAGYTLVINGVTCAALLLEKVAFQTCGSVRRVFDLQAFLDEVAKLKAQGVR